MLNILPLFITAIAAIIVVVASISPRDAFPIVAIELTARASLRAIFFVALVIAVVVTIAAPVQPGLMQGEFL